VTTLTETARREQANPDTRRMAPQGRRGSRPMPSARMGKRWTARSG